MNYQIVTLFTLVIAIFIGYKRKVNTGLVSIAFGFIVGFFIVKISVKQIIGGFPTSLFFILLGMTFMFSIAKVNGTLELIAKRVSYIAKGNTKLLPILFFVMCAVIAALGPGPIVVPALMLPVAMEVAKEENITDLLMATMVILGSIAGGLSPLSPSGIIASTLANEVGSNNYTPVFISVLLTGIIQAAILYLALGGLKLKGNINIKNKPENFNKNQIITLMVIAGVIIGILIFKLDIGLAAFTGAAILLLLGVADQKASIINIPWETLLLVSGVAILVNIVKITGGIDLLATYFSTIMGVVTAAPIMAIIAGLMSAVSSASGVVMPTLIPTTKEIAVQMGSSVTVSSLISGIVVGAHVVTLSPLSTLGALAMASSTDRISKDKLYTQLLALGFGSMVFAAILGLLGLFR